MQHSSWSCHSLCCICLSVVPVTSDGGISSFSWLWLPPRWRGSVWAVPALRSPSLLQYGCIVPGEVRCSVGLLPASASSVFWSAVILVDCFGCIAVGCGSRTHFGSLHHVDRLPCFDVHCASTASVHFLWLQTAVAAAADWVCASAAQLDPRALLRRPGSHCCVLPAHPRGGWEPETGIPGCLGCASAAQSLHWSMACCSAATVSLCFSVGGARRFI